MLGFGLLVVLNRNPVASALALVVSFLGLAALFILLDAHFLGVIQILVYAGAVMVLFLFIIMLLDLKAEERRRLNVTAVIGGGAGRRDAGGGAFPCAGKVSGGRGSFAPALAETGGGYDDVKVLGRLLFSDYAFHLQLIGVLLLTATVGVIVLSKSEAR